MPHLHLSLQSGDDMILKRMKRRPSARRCHSRSAEQARRLRPDIVFGADLIAGFPTETEAMFANSLRLDRRLRINVFSMSFPFSPPRRHAGRAHAASRGPAIKERAARLAAKRASRAWRAICNRRSARTWNCSWSADGSGRTPGFAEVELEVDAAAWRIS